MKRASVFCLGLGALLTACGPACKDGENKEIDLDANGVADCAETLVLNSQFVSGAASWTAGPEAAIAVDAMDGSAVAGSSALKVTNKASSTSPTIRAGRQCIAVTPESKYMVAANYYLQTGSPISGLGAQVEIRLYTEPACAGGEQNAQVTSIEMMKGAWGVVKTEVLTPRTQSVYFEASVRKNGTQPDADVLFDNMLLHKL